MSPEAFSDIKGLLDKVIATFGVIELKRGSVPTFQLRDAEYKLRRVRDRHFPAGYFGGSAWDMLLELDRAERLGRRYAVSDVGLGANIPPTTALRYLTMLERDGYVVRTSDPLDRRRVFLTLTDAGRTTLNNIFEEMVQSLSPRHEDVHEMVAA